MRRPLIAALLLGLIPIATVQAAPATSEAMMTQHAKGTFDVKIAPQPGMPDPTLGRMSLDKVYHGDLAATGIGTMLTAGNAATGSGAYVAVEAVSGTLTDKAGAGKAGGFALAHTGVMDAGARDLRIIIVPGSGTGALVGISGTLDIEIKDGQHFYDLAYRLPK